MIAFVAAAYGSGLTGDVADPLRDALVAELDRNRTGLRLADAPPIYHMRYQLLALAQADVQASLGSLVRSSVEPYHALGVEVRVGTPAFDNTGFGGWQNGFERSQLPEVLTPEALRAEAWRSTDAAYKEAVEQYARKASQFEAPDDWPGDYTLTGAVVADDGAATAERTTDRLEALARAMTSGMADPAVLRGEVYVGHEAGFLLTVDSEGTRVRSPIEETTIRALVQVRAPDGQLLTDQRLWTVRGVDSLPDDQELVTASSKMKDALLALAQCPTLDEEYVGPVLFEDEAALDVFRYVLVPQVEGTPPEIPFDSWFGDLGGDRDPVRLGRQVLPDGWTVVDDPKKLPDHPGSYLHDHEGTATEAVTLVDDGRVRDVAMSRVPRKGIDGTNGHARGYVGQRATGRVSLLEVTPDRSRSDAKLGRTAQRLAHEYGRDWVLVVRRLQEPAVLELGTDTYFDTEQTPLPPPVSVWRRWSDGREEQLRGVYFAGIQRWILRDVVLAGEVHGMDFMAPLAGSYGGQGPTEGIASHLVGPDLLIGEVEVVPAPGDPREVPVLAPPDLATR